LSNQAGSPFCVKGSNMVGIYKITSPSGKIYIGQSIDIKRRLRDYKKLRCKKQPKLHRSFLKYGYETHLIEIVENCSIDKLNDRERYYQELFNCVENGLNCFLTQSNHKTGKHSEETKKKLSIANSNPSLETRHRKSLGQVGKTVPEEMRKKISDSHKGKKHSLETRLKIAENSRNISDETRQKYRDSHIGHTHTLESRKKISSGLIGRNHSEETKLKISSKHGTRIIDVVTGMEFLSVAKAAKHLGCNISNLHNKLKGVRRNNTNLKYA